MSVHMRTLEDNAQALQRAGNQLMIKMVQRGNRRINVKHRIHKMKKCLTQIQSNKIVSIKLSFSMSIQQGFAFFGKNFCSYANCCTFEPIWKYKNHILTLSTGRRVKNIIGYNKKYLLTVNLTTNNQLITLSIYLLIPKGGLALLRLTGCQYPSHWNGFLFLKYFFAGCLSVDRILF